MELLESNNRLDSLIILSDGVHTRSQKPMRLAWKYIEYENSVQ